MTAMHNFWNPRSDAQYARHARARRNEDTVEALKFPDTAPMNLGSGEFDAHDLDTEGYVIEGVPVTLSLKMAWEDGWENGWAEGWEVGAQAMREHLLKVLGLGGCLPTEEAS